jgi:DNA polymerase
MKLWLDTETFSATPIGNGTYRYTSDCEVMILAYAVDDGPVTVIDLTAGGSLDDFLFYLDLADEVIAHNAMFDRNALRFGLGVDIPIGRWRCTMVRAMSHSLPGSLDKLCEILGINQDQAKHKAGKELVQLFCKPRPKTSKIRRATRATHPTEWARFIAYAGNDIAAMRAVANRMPEWNYRGSELALWQLDQRINDRGFAVDLELAQSAIGAIDKEQSRLAGAAWAHTDGALNAATQRDALLEHILAEYSIALPDLKGSTLERRLNDPGLPDGLKELLAIRLQASTTSTSKYKALINGATDGRMRGTLQFNGAGRTGRWAGRTFQPQNLPRPPRGFDEDVQEETVAAIKADTIDLLVDNVMEATSACLRGCIVAPPGKKLVVADLANIEGRMLAWLAGEKWKLQAFREYDTIVGEDEKGKPMRLGPDLYNLAYAKAFGIPVEQVDKDQRQVGKVMELAFGYEGGVGAWVTFAAAYGIDLEELGAQAYDSIPGQTLHEAGRFYDWTVEQGRSTMGLSRTAFVVCDSFKRLWRDAHPQVSSFWKELEAACVDAVANPATTIECRKLKVRRDGAWLRIALPSGRALCYPQPKLEDGKLTYMGINQYSRQWCRLKTYGGKLAENVTQAAARDVLAGGMIAVERWNFEIVLTVHDEIITEAPDAPEYDVLTLSQLMSEPPSWALDLPLAAAGFECHRYRKD